MRLFRCPCCEQTTTARSQRMTDSEMTRGYMMMRARGWTAERLLAERLDDLDGISPDLTAFVRRMVTSEAGGRTVQ